MVHHCNHHVILIVLNKIYNFRVGAADSKLTCVLLLLLSLATVFTKPSGHTHEYPGTVWLRFAPSRQRVELWHGDEEHGLVTVRFKNALNLLIQ